MQNVLFVNACIRPNSRTLELANCVLEKLSASVSQVDLYKQQLSPLSLAEMELRDKAVRDNDFSNGVFDLAKQFASAQTIVVAAPYWDLSFPAVLKSYFEKVTVNGFRPIEEAIVTSGGVSTKEIDPKTMESKLVKGLYFAGEVIDVDAYTGGFNLQIAFSTGRLAGEESSKQ